VVPPTSGPLCNGNAPVVAPREPGGVDHTIDAGVYLPVAAPPPSPTPPSPTPPATVPPTANPVPTNPLPTDPSPVGTHAGALAYTGVAGLPQMVILGVLLFGAGAVLAFASRKRRAGQR
jgi:hypothetical protein